MKADLKKLQLLARLWLHEPDDETLTQIGRYDGFDPANPAELATAYSDLLLLNVYPYASVFLEPDAELNGTRAQELSNLYEQHGYTPAELTQVAAPDHAGLFLGFLAQTEPPLTAQLLAHYTLDWLPTFCLAIAREPTAHPFYQHLAHQTRTTLFESTLSLSSSFSPSFSLSLSSSNEELTLRSLVHRLLCPAQSGLFLSRSQLGRWASQLGVPVPFTGRFQVALSLFEAAGIAGRITDLFNLLIAEVTTWQTTYSTWTAEYPTWQPYGLTWHGRTTATLHWLHQLQNTALTN